MGDEHDIGAMKSRLVVVVDTSKASELLMATVRQMAQHWCDHEYDNEYVQDVRFYADAALKLPQITPKSIPGGRTHFPGRNGIHIYMFGAPQDPNGCVEVLSLDAKLWDNEALHMRWMKAVATLAQNVAREARKWEALDERLEVYDGR